MKPTFIDDLSYSLDTLSRLKGIETFTVSLFFKEFINVFGYAFPFEGN